MGKICVTIVVLCLILCSLSAQVTHVTEAGESISNRADVSEEYQEKWQEHQEFGNHKVIYEEVIEEDVPNCHEDSSMPFILWWTPFTGSLGVPRHCAGGSCCLTQDRSKLHRQNTKVVLFYGTDFEPDDLPLPRRKNMWWGLLHEESPKNKPILNHLSALQAFNLTGTFKQESDFPLSLQYLPSISSLTSKREFVPTWKKNKVLKYNWNPVDIGLAENAKRATESKNPAEESALPLENELTNGDKLFSKAGKLTKNGKPREHEKINKIAPIVYVHSDCDAPSERDEYMLKLSKHIEIDSLGNCHNTRSLPPHLRDSSEFNHPSFRQILAKYKFTLTIENYGCDDYITEKFWRPLTLGSVPIYWGSPRISDWAPNPKSVIKISDFSSPKDLADYLYTLLKDDHLYETHLAHKINGEITNDKLITEMSKRQWGLDDLEKGNFIDHFECFVCDEIHHNHPDLNSKPKYHVKTANISHYGCPEPKTVLTNRPNERSFWLEEYEKSKVEAEVLGDFLQHGKLYSQDKFYTKVFEKLRGKDFFNRFPPRHDEF